MKKITAALGVLACLYSTAQTIVPKNRTKVSATNLVVKPETEQDDIEYEIKHKSQPWFAQMNQARANYFAVKNAFEKYFVNHQWEKSKPRELGESWLKNNIFYLDKNGKVQAPPAFDASTHETTTPNQITGTTTRTMGSWTMLGPVNSATTAYSGRGNHGGYAYMVRIDPTNTQKMFAGFVTGGLWMTADAGASWTLTDGNIPAATYMDMDVCIGNPQIVYAINQKQVIKSTDGGLNWVPTALNTTNYSGTAYDIAVSPTQPNIVVARWADKIYRTTDSGDTWTEIVSGLPTYTVWDCNNTGEMLDWSTTVNNIVYFLSTASDNKVTLQLSVDNGAIFLPITTITLDAAANGQKIGWAKLLLPSNNTTAIYVAVGTGASAYAHGAVHLYKLNNTTGTELLNRVNMISGTLPNELHHGDIAMDRNNENRIVYGTYSQDYVHYSNDNGATFTNAANNTHSDIRSIDIVNNIVAIGSDGEVALSNNGGINYATVTNTISNHELWGFGAAFKSNIVAGGCNHGPVMINEPSGAFEWYNGTGADQGNTDVNPLDDRYVYSQGYSNYRYFRTGVHTLINESNSLDLGGIYAYFNSIEFHPNYYYSIITHHAGQYPTGNPNLATWKNSLVKTEDNGNSLSIVKTFTSQVFREKICMTNPNYIYVVAGLTNNKLWRTTDGGTNWADITPTLLASSGQVNISDLAVSDVNPNEVWLTYSSVQTTCKVLKTNDGGTAWTNLTQPILTANPNTKIIFQRGSDGGVYVGNKSGIYYRNNSMANWVLLGNGLPEMDIRFMFINYNLGKLRIGTSRGAWEHNLYEVSPPKAQIAVGSKRILCPEVEPVQFKDYSVVRNASATWSWSFPGGSPATSTLENPVVSYKNAPDGFYNASLTITDAFGSSTQTINNIIEISNKCGSTQVDTIPGKVASLGGNSTLDFINVPGLNSNTSGFTFSCWVKPNGTQPDFSGIFMTQAGSAFGLNFRPGSNQLGFHPNWSWNSGLYTPADKWTHVVLVSDATGVTIYADGKASKNTSLFSNINFSELKLATYGRGYTNRSVNCQLDEVCIWNRALSTDEVRQWRHLTKSNAGDAILSGMVAYYQFNEAEGNLTLNKYGNNHATYGGGGFSHVASTAPVHSGISEKININTGGIKNFTSTGLSVTFPAKAGSVYPNGDVWVTRTFQLPDQLADTFVPPNGYWIVNNYGPNTTFSPIEQMDYSGIANFNGTAIVPAISLYKRNSNDFGSTWGTPADIADAVSGSGTAGIISFSTGLSVTSFSQFTFSASSIILPLHILYFTASVSPVFKNEVQLKLAVETRYLNQISKMEIECSNDGRNFKYIHILNLFNGINDGVKTWYTIYDKPTNAATYYYRVKQTDKSSEVFYSEIKEVKLKGNNLVPAIMPNMIRRNSPFNCNVPLDWDKCTLMIYDAQEKNLVTVTMHAGQNYVLTNIPAGSYVVRISSKNEVVTAKLIIQ